MFIFPGVHIHLQVGSRNISCNFVGLLVLHKTITPNHFILMTADGIIFLHLVEEAILKSGFIRATLGNVLTLAGMKHVIKTRLKVW